MAINLMTDKFMCPQLPETCIPRQELFKLYSKSAKTRLTAVCAPIGYGKTISTLLWARSYKQKYVWIDLDEYDNSLFRFYHLFCTGIFATQPDNQSIKKTLTSPDFKSTPVEHTISLLSEIESDGQSYSLILDNFQTIASQTVLESFPYILKRLPHSFNILILSRGLLPEPINELIENRKSLIITSDSLAFSLDEIDNYYRTLGHTLSSSQSQSILCLTGGWAVGVHALSRKDPAQQYQDDERILCDYLTKNVWNKCNPELQEFMLLTAVADELDSELSNLLTGKKNADTIFERLIVQNTFVVKIAADTYCYHPLFLNFLRYKLKKHPHLDVREINSKITDLYFIRRDFFRALDFYVRSGNLDGINRSFYQLNTGYQDFSVEDWLNRFTTLVQDKLPEEIVQNDFPLLLEYAWANFLNGDAQATLRYLDRINDYIGVKENFDVICQSDLAGAIGIIRFADFRQGICAYSRDFSNWVKLLPENPSVNMYAPSITQNFPIMHRSICDCLEIMTDLEPQLQEIKNAFAVFFPQEVDLFCCCVKAGLYYEINDIEKAYKTIGIAQQLLIKETRAEMRFCISMLLSQILNAMEKKRETESVRSNCCQQIQTENALYLYPNFSAIDTKHRLWDGDKKAAEKWLSESFVSVDEPLRFYKLYQHFTTARALIVLSKQEEAMEYLEKLEKISADYHRPLDLAEAGVLKAALKWAVGAKEEAVQILENVLTALQPYRAIRIVADEGASVLPILKKLTIKICKADYSGQLDRHYLKQVFLCAYQVSKKHSGITAHLYEKSIKLSKQQQNILTLLAKGYSSTEIVSITGRTINTVKSHTKMLYLKLDVHNAADAVLKAKQLGFLESS